MNGMSPSDRETVMLCSVVLLLNDTSPLVHTYRSNRSSWRHDCKEGIIEFEEHGLQLRLTSDITGSRLCVPLQRRPIKFTERAQQMQSILWLPIIGLHLHQKRCITHTRWCHSITEQCSRPSKSKISKSCRIRTHSNTSLSQTHVKQRFYFYTQWVKKSRLPNFFQNFVRCWPIFTALCTIVQKAVLRLHVVRPSVCLSVTLVD